MLAGDASCYEDIVMEIRSIARVNVNHNFYSHFVHHPFVMTATGKEEGGDG